MCTEFDKIHLLYLTYTIYASRSVMAPVCGPAGQALHILSTNISMPELKCGCQCVVPGDLNESCAVLGYYAVLIYFTVEA